MWGRGVTEQQVAAIAGAGLRLEMTVILDRVQGSVGSGVLGGGVLGCSR